MHNMSMFRRHLRKLLVIKQTNIPIRRMLTMGNPISGTLGDVYVDNVEKKIHTLDILSDILSQKMETSKNRRHLQDQ